MFLNYFLRNYLRNHLVNFILEKLINIKCWISLTKKERIIFNQWSNFREIKNDNKKKYIVYAPTIKYNWMGFHLQQLFFLNSFKLCGLTPLILNSYNLKNIYKNLSFKTLPHIYYFLPKNFNPEKIKIKINNSSINNLKKFTYKKVQCFRFAENSTLRELKKSYIDFKSARDVRIYKNFLLKSAIYTEAFLKIKKKFNIVSGLFNDHDMCGESEIFSILLNNKKPLYSITAGYKNNTFYFKKYFKKNKSDHPRSCSKETIKILNKTNINKNKIKWVKNEILSGYKKKTWEIFSKTQTNTKLISKNEIIKKLKISKNKINVVVFSHIYFDATFSWGKNLFENYEIWLVETIRALKDNKNVNLILKVHPSNISKDKSKDNLSREIISLKKEFGNIPSNLSIVPADTKINTISIIKLIDACITVRGTVGIESAIFNKFVITAGGGRYDKLGFTKDFDSKKNYIKFLKNLNKRDIVKKNYSMAVKFGYFNIYKRVFFPKSKISKYNNDKKNYPEPTFSPRDLFSKKYQNDQFKIKKWINSNEVDYLN